MSILNSFRRNGLELILGTVLIAGGVGAAAQVPQFTHASKNEVPLSAPANPGVPQFTHAAQYEENHPAPASQSEYLDIGPGKRYTIESYLKGGEQLAYLYDHQTAEKIPICWEALDFSAQYTSAGKNILDNTMHYIEMTHNIPKDLRDMVDTSDILRYKDLKVIPKKMESGETHYFILGMVDIPLTKAVKEYLVVHAVDKAAIENATKVATKANQAIIDYRNIRDSPVTP